MKRLFPNLILTPFLAVSLSALPQLAPDDPLPLSLEGQLTLAMAQAPEGDPPAAAIREGFPQISVKVSSRDGEGHGREERPDRDGASRAEKIREAMECVEEVRERLAEIREAFPQISVKVSSRDGEGHGREGRPDRDGASRAEKIREAMECAEEVRERLAEIREAFPQISVKVSSRDGEGHGREARPDRDGDSRAGARIPPIPPRRIPDSEERPDRVGSVLGSWGGDPLRISDSEEWLDRDGDSRAEKIMHEAMERAEEVRERLEAEREDSRAEKIMHEAMERAEEVRERLEAERDRERRSRAEARREHDGEGHGSEGRPDRDGDFRDEMMREVMERAEEVLRDLQGDPPAAEIRAFLRQGSVSAREAMEQKHAEEVRERQEARREHDGEGHGREEEPSDRDGDSRVGKMREMQEVRERQEAGRDRERRSSAEARRGHDGEGHGREGRPDRDGDFRAETVQEMMERRMQEFRRGGMPGRPPWIGGGNRSRGRAPWAASRMGQSVRRGARAGEDREKESEVREGIAARIDEMRERMALLQKENEELKGLVQKLREHGERLREEVEGERELVERELHNRERAIELDARELELNSRELDLRMKYLEMKAEEIEQGWIKLKQASDKARK